MSDIDDTEPNASALRLATDARKAPMPTPTITVLIVEDDVAFAYAAWRHLEANGYRVITVNGALDALAQLENAKIDIVISDVRLAKDGPDGILLARMIRQEDANIPIILVTAYPELVQHKKELPGQVFYKPVELSTLRRAVEARLAA